MLRGSFLAIVFFLVACSAKNEQTDVLGEQASANDVYVALLKQYAQWQGVPYRFGGNDNQGLDCSALVQHVFRDSFALALPRTTLEQVNVGKAISPSQLRAGDLAFFKTGENQRHVGVMLDKDNFLHVSTKSGVTITPLNNPYWQPRFWQARRVL